MSLSFGASIGIFVICVLYSVETSIARHEATTEAHLSRVSHSIYIDEKSEKIQRSSAADLAIDTIIFPLQQIGISHFNHPIASAAGEHAIEEKQSVFIVFWEIGKRA